VEGGAELIDDSVQRSEEFIARAVSAQMIPEVFERVEFGAAGRETHATESGVADPVRGI